MIDNALCPWCNSEIETIHHAFVECSRVQGLWDDALCPEMVNWSAHVSVCDLIVSWLDVKKIQRGMFLARSIWRDRNNKVFQDKSTPNVVIIEHVFRHVEE